MADPHQTLAQKRLLEACRVGTLEGDIAFSCRWPESYVTYASNPSDTSYYRDHFYMMMERERSQLILDIETNDILSSPSPVFSGSPLWVLDGMLGLKSDFSYEPKSIEYSDALMAAIHSVRTPRP